MHRTVANFIPLLFLCCLIVSPVRAVGEEELIKYSIEHFNRALTLAATEGKFEMLKEFTTEKHGTKVYIWCKSWHENGLVPHITQKQLRFTDIQVDANTSTVQTEELWHYWYRNAPERSVYIPEHEIRYKIKYSLVKKEGLWVVSDALVLEESQKPLQPIE